MTINRLILYLFLCVGQTLAWAQQPGVVLERAFLKDPQAQLSLEQVSASAFKPYESHLGLGFQPGAIWTRLTIARAGPGQDEAGRRRVLRVGPNYLERIELYALNHGQWQRQVRGALMPQASRDCPDDMHCFVIEASSERESIFYLRIAHRGFMVVQMEVLPPESLPAAVAKRVRDLTISMVIAVGLLVLGLVLLLLDRSLLLLAYCGFQLTVVLFIASNAGRLASVFPAVPGEWQSLFNNFVYVVRVTMTGLLAWSVLRFHKPGRAYLFAAKMLLVMCMVNALLVLSGHVQWGLRGSLMVFIMIPLWQLYGVWSAQSLPVGQRRVLVGGIALYLLMLSLGVWLNFTQEGVVPQLGLIRQIVEWRLNGFAVGVLFFWITMLERSSQKRIAAQEMETLRHQAMEARARQAELNERTALIDMLTHELKNPLGTIRFALASLRSGLAHPDALKRIQSIDLSARRMDDLIERVANFSKIERSAPADATSEMDAAALIQEVMPDVPDSQQWDIHVQPGATFRGDRQLLWVILENLMSNASKYALHGHKICIEVDMEERVLPPVEGMPAPGQALRMTRWVISNHVAPTCVPEEAILFDRYYRHPNVQSQAGMGLGLSIVQSAVQKIRGEIAYRHEHGQVFFTLRVPA